MPALLTAAGLAWFVVAFPKGTDLTAHSLQHLLAVENELNNRPGRVLGDQPQTSSLPLLASESPSVCDVD